MVDQSAHPPLLSFGTLWSKVRVHVVLALVQTGFAGFQLLTKLAFNAGLNKTVYPIYRNVLGCLFILPIAAYFERKERPRLTFIHILHFFFLGLTAVAFGQALFLLGLHETSPTFASAFQNSIPALTFVIAAISRVDDVNLCRWDGQAKLIGALTAGAGATVMTVYKGPLIFQNGSSAPLAIVVTETQEIPKTWHLGSLYLLVSCVAFACYYVLQAKSLKIYPARISTVCFTNAFGAAQLALFTVASQPTASIWKISGRIQLVAVLYAGLVASGVAFSAQAWCMQQAGPVVVSAYQPLQTVVVGFISFFFLGEDFYLGSILGAVLIVFGLYLVIWGQEKHKEHLTRQNSPHASEDDKVEQGLGQPLLHH